MKKVVSFQRSDQDSYPVEVQGEALYRENIERILGGLDEENRYQRDFVAHLILEDDNAVDSFPVRVELEGQKVGYLSEPDAKLYQAKLVDLGLSNVVGKCVARINEVFSDQGEIDDYIVRLGIDLSNLTIADDEVTEQILIPEQPVIPPKRKYSPAQMVAATAGMIFSCSCLGCAGLYVLRLMLGY